MTRLVVFALFLIFASTAARADWQRADSDHFVVYADDTAEDLSAFTRQLERFHSALALTTNTQEVGKPSPSNRVTIFVVRNVTEVRKLLSSDSRDIGGFYVPRAGQSIAIVPSIKIRSDATEEFSMLTLLHEYTHHYFHSTSTFPMPRWLSEGGAEFFSSASFEKDGTVLIGRPAKHRGMELVLAVDVKAEELLDPDVYEAKKGRSSAYNAFYGKSWLLYHYLSFDEERKGQLRNYIRAMVTGKSSREAALSVFGSFEQLDKDLANYLRKRKMSALSISHQAIRESAVKLRPLSTGEAAMMPVMIRSKVGVSSEEAAKIVVDGRAVAARFPKDAAVLAMFAENEFDAENYDAAIAAADAALALDPAQVNAYVQKGYALFAKAKDADDRDKAYAEALQPFLRLNRYENDHPLPLVFFYRSFKERGARPTPLAIQGLQRAAELAPFDLGLKMMVARQHISDGNLIAAHSNLKPIAYNPHGGELSQVAKDMLEKIDSGADPAAKPAAP